MDEMILDIVTKSANDPKLIAKVLPNVHVSNARTLNTGDTLRILYAYLICTGVIEYLKKEGK